MSTDRETARIVRSWLEEGVTALPDRVLDAVLDQVPATPQRRSWWPARRFNHMNTYAKLIAGTAAAVLVVGFVGYQLLPGISGPGGPPKVSATPQASPSMIPTQEPSASLKSRALTPFGPAGSDDKDPRAASIRVAFAAPASWELFSESGVSIGGNDWPDGAAVFFYRGGGLFGDPCLTENEAEADADVPVGPTVDDLVTALVDHPSLDVTSPVDVTLAGYSGTYLDLLVPDDIKACATYKPMDGHIYAQGPGQRWHMWVLDVDGVRVLVETNDYAGTSTQRLAEEQAIVNSLQIAP